MRLSGYAAEHNGAVPTDLKADLITNGHYLRGTDLPICPVAGGNNAVKPVVTAGPLTPNDDASFSWMYSTADGTFICNSSGASKSDPTTTYDKF